MKEQILQILKENPKYYFRKIPKEISMYLSNKYPGLPLKEQISRFINYESGPVCKICGSNNLYFLSVIQGYSETCSKKCSYELRKLEYQRKYGVDNPGQVPEMRQKIKNTMLARYGYSNAAKCDFVQEKKKKTCLEKYGVEYYTQTDEYTKKCIDTNKRKYNVEYHTQSKEGKEKIKKTVKQKYGVENPSQSQCIKDKKRKTSLLNYGVDNYFKTEEFKTRRRDVNIEKHGVEHHEQNQFSILAKDVLFDKIKLEQELQKVTPIELSKKLNVAFSTIYNYALKYGIREKFTDFSTEIIIQNILNELQIKFIKNDRQQIKPKELDFYCYEDRIAIEVCGLRWHSESVGKDKSYHLIKLEECNKNGIRLITIFEDELTNYEKIYNRLLYIFNKVTTGIFARNCQINYTSYNIICRFLEMYHMQGTVRSNINIAATYNNEVVAVMTFGKLRRPLGSKHKDGVYELVRFCTNQKIPGIASRLFKRFIKDYQPIEIISYSDRRWNTGNLYEVLGFAFNKNTQPNYWYTKDYKIRESRYKFTKHKIIEEFDVDPLLSEKEIMKSLGYDRIWDCGSSKWIWVNNLK